MTFSYTGQCIKISNMAAVNSVTCTIWLLWRHVKTLYRPRRSFSHSSRLVGTVALPIQRLILHTQLRCNQGKWVWTQSNSILIFLIDYIHLLQNYLLHRTQLKLGKWFTWYRQLWRVTKTVRNKEICLVWLYLKISICEFWLILLDHITITHKSLCTTPFFSCASTRLSY